ncbi:MAG: hypothetical protein JSU88_10720 [Nitrospinaceae bacterium]|jgi:hypothetical protein|nr:MAG: hypothetical protein JSU88_10720 [Nitrospinaceae bacterium]
MYNSSIQHAKVLLSKKWLPGLLLCGLICWGAAPAHAGDAFNACAKKAAARDLEAKKDFQNRLHALIVTGKPEFKALAAINRDLQIQLAKARKEKLEYLLKKHPERIITTQGISRFTNFDWSDADESRFLSESETNKKRQESIADLNERNNFHTDWPRLRGFFRSELTKTPAYKTLMSDFTKSQVEVKKILSACNPSK